MELRMALTSAFQEAGIPVVMLHTSSIASAEKGQIVTMDVAAVRGFLKVGMIPLLGGDMVQDSVMGFSVGSGDQVARVLAKEFRSSDLIFATDVAGVYDVDPKANPLARPLKELSLANLMNVSSGEGMVDASGAMRGKLSNLEGLAQELKTGLRASIISMMEPGNLKGVLKGVEFKGTWIRP
jgi:isopentenyl phosphate kinase